MKQATVISYSALEPDKLHQMPGSATGQCLPKSYSSTQDSVTETLSACFFTSSLPHENENYINRGNVHWTCLASHCKMLECPFEKAIRIVAFWCNHLPLALVKSQLRWRENIIKIYSGLPSRYLHWLSIPFLISRSRTPCIWTSVPQCAQYEWERQSFQFCVVYCSR